MKQQQSLRHTILLGLAIAAALLISRALVSPTYHLDNPDFITTGLWDHLQYIWSYMRLPSSGPFAYRLLTPALVHLISGDPQSAWETFTFVSLWGAMFVTGLLALDYGFNPWLVTIVVASWAFTYACQALLYNFWLVDPLHILLMALALYAARKHQALAFVALCGIGTISKETMFFVLPVWWAFNRDNRRAIIPAALTCIGVYAALHLSIHPPINLSLTQALLDTIPFKLARFNVLDFTIAPFGLLLPLIFINARAASRALVPYRWFLVLCFAQYWIASDTARNLAIAMPALTVGACAAAVTISVRFRAGFGNFSVSPTSEVR